MRSRATTWTGSSSISAATRRAATARASRIALSFFPYAAEPRPFLLTLDAGEKKGVMQVEGYDHDYPGGPRLPDRYRPYIAGSP